MKGAPLRRCSVRNQLVAFFVSISSLMSFAVMAGGITLSSTRIIYPANTKQMSTTVRNTSEQSSFLVQSWVESGDGEKNEDFIVTPPLYVSGPGNDNTLRLMYVGKPASKDRETLYYFNTKAIPSVDRKKMEGNNVLMLAAVTRIKLFVRPDGLSPSVEKAPTEISFHYTAGKVRIDNPTPYYITLAKIKVGGHKLPDTMISPKGSISLSQLAKTGDIITFRTINDFGALTPEQTTKLK